VLLFCLVFSLVAEFVVKSRYSGKRVLLLILKIFVSSLAAQKERLFYLFGPLDARVYVQA
jgi:hypothetical protein